MTSPPTDADVEAIVRGLTSDQRETLVELAAFDDEQRLYCLNKGARPMDVSASQGRKAAVTLKQLCKKGLARLYNWAGPNERGSCRYWIEPLGLAVRNHLLSKDAS